MTTNQTTDTQNLTDDNQNQENTEMTTQDQTMTDNTNNQEITMNLQTLDRIRLLCRNVLSLFNEEGVNLKEEAEEFNAALGNLYWLCTLHKDGVNEQGKIHLGRAFYATGCNLVSTEKGEDARPNRVWLNCPDVINFQCELGQDKNEEQRLLAFIKKSWFDRNGNKQVKALLQDRSNFWGNVMMARAFHAMTLLRTKKQYEEFQAMMVELDNLTKKTDTNPGLHGAKALILNPETDEVVAKHGANNWVFPSVVDMVDPKLHISKPETNTEGKAVYLVGPTIAEFFGMDLNDLPSDDTELNMEDHIDAFANC